MTEDEQVQAGFAKMLAMSAEREAMSTRYLTELFGIIQRAKNLDVVRQMAGEMHARMVKEIEGDIRFLEAMKP